MDCKSNHVEALVYKVNPLAHMVSSEALTPNGKYS